MAQLLRPELVAQDTLRFQRWIHSRQYPTDCGTTIGAFPKQEYFWGLGLGAQMVALKFGLLNALLQGQVYHLPTSHYTNPLRCPSRSFDCYFEPASHCKRESHRRVADARIYWCTDMPSRKLSQLAGLAAVHPKEWYQAQLAAFLFRPNDDLLAMRSQLLMPGDALTLERSDPRSNASLSIAAAAVTERKKKPRGLRGRGGGGKGRGGKNKGGGGLATRVAGVLGRRLDSAAAPPRPAGVAAGRARALNGSCVAMHIRRTDKFKTNRKEDHMPMRTFPECAAAPLPPPPLPAAARAATAAAAAAAATTAGATASVTAPARPSARYAQLFKGWAYWKAALPPARLSLLLGRTAGCNRRPTCSRTSARLVAPRAHAAPTDPGAPPACRESLRWAQELASGRPPQRPRRLHVHFRLGGQGDLRAVPAADRADALVLDPLVRLRHGLERREEEVQGHPCAPASSLDPPPSSKAERATDHQPSNA